MLRKVALANAKTTVNQAGSVSNGQPGCCCYVTSNSSWSLCRRMSCGVKTNGLPASASLRLSPSCEFPVGQSSRSQLFTNTRPSLRSRTRSGCSIARTSFHTLLTVNVSAPTAARRLVFWLWPSRNDDVIYCLLYWRLSKTKWCAAATNRPDSTWKKYFLSTQPQKGPTFDVSFCCLMCNLTFCFWLCLHLA